MKNQRTYIPFAVCSVTFFLCLWMAMSGFDTAIENHLYQLFLTTRGTALSAVLLFFTTLGNTVGVISVVVILLLLPGKIRLRLSLPVAAAVLASWLLNEGIKHIVERARPDVVRMIAVTGYSFPSGHAMNNSTLYLTILFLFLLYVKRPALRRTAWVVLILIPVIIGASRVYFGAHYITDVVAGWAMGSFIAYATFLIVRRMDAKALQRQEKSLS